MPNLTDIPGIPQLWMRTKGDPLIDLSSHATHISSTILGQHGSPAPGIAPNCTAINIPIAFDNDNFISPVNLTDAINTALKFGANIIHIAACHP